MKHWEQIITLMVVGGCCCGCVASNETRTISFSAPLLFHFIRISIQDWRGVSTLTHLDSPGEWTSSRAGSSASLSWVDRCVVVVVSPLDSIYTHKLCNSRMCTYRFSLTGGNRGRAGARRTGTFGVAVCTQQQSHTINSHRRPDFLFTLFRFWTTQIDLISPGVF